MRIAMCNVRDCLREKHCGSFREHAALIGTSVVRQPPVGEVRHRLVPILLTASACPGDERIRMRERAGGRIGGTMASWQRAIRPAPLGREAGCICCMDSVLGGSAEMGAGYY